MNDTGGDYSENQTYIGQQRMLYQRFLFIMLTFVIGPLILLGVFGNIIAFCTFAKMVPQNATTLLLRSLAITDLCVLLDMTIHMYVRKIYMYGESWFSTAKLIHPYVVTYIGPCFYILTLANVWITVIVGFHRYIVVCRPLQAARLCTTSHAGKQVVCVILISTVFVMPDFFAYKLNRVDGATTYEHWMIENKWYFYIYALRCTLAFKFIIPFSMLFVFYVHVIASLHIARRQPLGRQSSCNVDSRVSSMLIVLLGIFLVTHAANFCHGLLNAFMPDSRDVRIQLMYTFPIVKLGIVLNSSVNCLIYMVYIKELKKIVCKRCTHNGDQNQVYEVS